MHTLTPTQTQSVLKYLRLETAPPALPFLTALLNAYVRTVPWESASRMVRRARVHEAEQYPRWPEEFWDGAMTHGLGGTCFESNYAFLALLSSLGFHGSLTINDMNEHIGCHTATVIELDGAQWLADAGFPVHVPLQLSPTQQTKSESRWMTYSAQPLPNNVFVIERPAHPSPYCFTVHNTPVADADYRAATLRDYGPSGLFLREVIINKVIDDQLWRFSSRDPQPNLHTFVDGQRVDHPIGTSPHSRPEEIAQAVAHKFGMNEATLYEALQLIS